MSRGRCIILTCHGSEDLASVKRLCGLAEDVGLTPYVIWQTGSMSQFVGAGLRGAFEPHRLGKGGAVQSALWAYPTGLGALTGPVPGPWLVVDGDLRSLPPQAMSDALTRAETGVWVRGLFETVGRLNAPVAHLMDALGHHGAGFVDSRVRAALWTSGVQAYPDGAMSWRDLMGLPRGYGFDVAAAALMTERLGEPLAVHAGPRDHRATDRAHLARVLGEVAHALGEQAPAWSPHARRDAERIAEAKPW